MMGARELLLALPGYRMHLSVAVAAGLTLLVVQWVWTPSVKPIPPAAMAINELSVGGLSPQTDARSVDFVFRPLFNESRRPSSDRKEAVVDSAPQQEKIEVLADMDGYVLLGVFASGDREGVILRSKDGRRQRLYLGAEIDGWTLTAVDARSGTFSGPAGERGMLGLALATSLPSATVTAAPKERSEQPVSQVAELDEVEDSPKRMAPVTFDAIWEQHERDAQKGRGRNTGESADRSSAVIGGRTGKPKQTREVSGSE